MVMARLRRDIAHAVAAKIAPDEPVASRTVNVHIVGDSKALRDAMIAAVSGDIGGRIGRNIRRPGEPGGR